MNRQSFLAGVSFDDSGSKKCINIFRNGDFEHGKTLYVEPHWVFQDLLNAASQRLELGSIATRMFTIDGVDIDDCMMLEDSDIVFLADHDDQGFIRAYATVEEGDEGDKTILQTLGNYKVGKFLGRGGFGEVRIGEHQLSGEKVALKFLRKAHIATIGAAERTAVEIQCLSALKHQNIIRLEQHIDSPAHVVLVFELMEGGDLQKYLHSRGQTNSKMALSENESRPLFRQLLSAISYAHNQHICHRDLKLENILLKGEGDLSEIKIADFGLSDFYRPGAMMKSNCGTLSFLAPEVFRGTSNAGPPLDVWSLGVILFAILCGRLPFEATEADGTKRPREQIIRSRIMKCQYKIDDDIGPEAKDLVRRMLKPDPVERASVPELLGHCWLRSDIGVDFNEEKIPAGKKNIKIGHGSEVATPSSQAGLESIVSSDSMVLAGSDSISELSLEIEKMAADRSSSRSPFNDAEKSLETDESVGGALGSGFVFPNGSGSGSGDQALPDLSSSLSPRVCGAGAGGTDSLESQTFKLVPLRRSRSQISGSLSGGNPVSISTSGSASDLCITEDYPPMSSSSAFSSPISGAKANNAFADLPPMTGASVDNWIQQTSPAANIGSNGAGLSSGSKSRSNTLGKAPHSPQHPGLGSQAKKPNALHAAGAFSLRSSFRSQAVEEIQK